MYAYQWMLFNRRKTKNFFLKKLLSNIFIARNFRGFIILVCWWYYCANCFLLGWEWVIDWWRNTFIQRVSELYLFFVHRLNVVNGHTSFDHDIYVLSHRLPVFIVYLVISRNIDYKPYNMTTSKHLIHRMVQSDAGHLIFVYFIMLKMYLNIKNDHLLDISFGIWKYHWKCDFSQTGLTFIMIYSYFLETTPSQSNVFRGTLWT